MMAVTNEVPAGTTTALCVTPASTGFTPPPRRRMGHLATVQPPRVAEARALYQRPPAGMPARLAEAGWRNCSVYYKEVEGRPCLFCYAEPETTAADLSADAVVRPWLDRVASTLAPLPGMPDPTGGWETAEPVFHTDGASDVVPRQVRRIAAITGLKPEKEAWYRTLHAAPWPQVNATIKTANIRNYTIYLKAIGEKLYLLSYFEYVGDDYDADMRKIARCPVTRRWWKETDACQLPLPEAARKGQIWEEMEEIFYSN